MAPVESGFSLKRNKMSGMLILDDVWRICDEAKLRAIELIAAGRNQEAVSTAIEIVSKYESNSWSENLAAEIIQWANYGPGDLLNTSRSLRFADSGILGFVNELAAYESRSEGRGKFFIAATMPKSAGTYIFKRLLSTDAYETAPTFLFGSATDNYISESRIRFVKNIKGICSHTHIAPNIHNKSIISNYSIPLWIHFRDPRDCFLSFLHMIKKEKARNDIDSDIFYKMKVAQNLDLDRISFYSYDELFQIFIEEFNYYCFWLEKWLNFNHDNLFVSNHQDLVEDEDKLIRDLSRFLSFEVTTIADAVKDYKDTRFNIGTNGRWKSDFSVVVKDEMWSILERYALDKKFYCA
jgi:hypothetical protein